MFDLESFSLAEAMRDSDDYKVLVDNGCIYVFSVAVNFNKLAQTRGKVEWEQSANIIIDETGRVVKNRYGRISG